MAGAAADPGRLIVPLDQAAGPGLGADQLGGKAATLARLVAAGFPVPPGFVVPVDAFARWQELEAALPAAADAPGGGRLAVRSSAVAEDLAGASYAGLYETFLNVDRDHLVDAVRRCWESATSQRVTAYQHARQQGPEQPQQASGGPGPRPGPGAIAVLVQRMVHPDAAGVAFTANPVSGARDEVVITAVRGLGERLVSGEATGDRWVVRGEQAACTRAVEQAIDDDQARAVATLARRVEAHFAAPQDVEWAIADGTLWLLQARPMTALPEPVTWTPPAPGYWMRNFRLGEWLPEPMTPLFADWLLERIEDGHLKATRDHVGASLVFPRAAINGWYYTAIPRLSLRTILAALLGGRVRLVRFLRDGVLGPARDPVSADGACSAASPSSGARTCCRATSRPSTRPGSASRPPHPSSSSAWSTRSACWPGSTCGRWRWWAGRRGRWKAPRPASTANTWPPGSTPASSSCLPACPEPNPTCHRTRCKASTGPTRPPASWAGGHPSRRTGTAPWPPSARR